MQRMFFHNQHDKESREILQTLKGDVKVYDVFGADKNNLPEGIRLSVLPYLVDRYIKFTPNGPYVVDTPFILEFECMDYLDQPVTGEVEIFDVNIDGFCYSAATEKGVLRVEITCPDVRTVIIGIEALGYLPFNTEIEVV